MSAVPPSITSALATGVPRRLRIIWCRVGIPAPQLGVISYGKERPVCEEHDEA